MKDVIVFAHMMKTAGTSLSKQLIGHYGRRMHIVPGGLKMDNDYYNEKGFENDFQKLDQKLEIITGHPMRPYIDFGKYEKNMIWFTFFREPNKRYVSHYLHDYKWKGLFSKKKSQRKRKDLSIIEWERSNNFSNYQTKFIAGENNFDKAVELLETKIKWVGLTEEYKESLNSFKSNFNLNDFHFNIERSNTSLADKEMKESVHSEYSEYIQENNENDIKLYNYVKNNIWPKYKLTELKDSEFNSGKSKFTRNINTVLFHLNRQINFRTSEINLTNIKRFHKRWYT